MNSEFTIAVHSLVLLAYIPGHMASSDYIASNVTTHPARVRKIMGFLRKQDYVTTKEGIGGGYILNCDPAKVTLGEVYRATALGSLKPNWCSGDPTMECHVSSNMEDVMAAVFCEAELHLESYLEKLTIQDVLNRVKKAQECKP